MQPEVTNQATTAPQEVKVEQKRSRKQKGFTLTELVIVLSLIHI